MEQLGFEDMPVRLFSCTPSRLTTWSDCPRRYRMTYLDRPTPVRGPAMAHTTVGAVVHLALARFWDLPEQRRTPAAARSLVSAAWQTDGFADAAQAARWRDRAGEMVERYLASAAAPRPVEDDPDAERRPPLDLTDRPAGVERTVGFTTRTLAVSGRVDRVDRRGDEVVVVDYKTGRSPCTSDEARGSLAMALYALGCARTFRRPCTTVELHHVPSGTVASHTHTPESLDRHVRRAEAVAVEVVRATESLAGGGSPEELFPPRPSSVCGWCDFSRHCPEGLAASGGPQQPWAGLAEERAPLDD